MMNIEDAISLLEHHASVTPCDEDRSYSSLSYAIYMNLRRNSQHKLSNLLNEVIECLEVINREINGEVPSSVSATDKLAMIDIRVVRAISYLLIEAFQYVITRASSTFHGADYTREFLVYQIIVEAWEGVVGGDTDSLREHVHLEERLPLLDSE